MASFEERMAFMGEIRKDLDLALELVATEDESKKAPARRVYVRLALDSLESVIHVQKTWALEGGGCFFGRTGGLFTEAEAMLLRDVKPVLRRRGEVGEAPAMLDLVDNVGFLLRQLAKTEKLTFERLWECVDVDELRRAKAIRNRITHAKNLADLAVSDEDFATVRAAWQSVNAALMKAANATPNAF